MLIFGSPGLWDDTSIKENWLESGVKSITRIRRIQAKRLLVRIIRRSRDRGINRWGGFGRIFSQVLLYLTTLHVSKEKNTWIKSEIYICTLISMPSKPSMENPVGLFVILVTFLKLSPPFATCISQLQGMTAPPPALLFFAHF